MNVGFSEFSLDESWAPGEPRREILALQERRFETVQL
jgi:hypothetical protein